MNIRLKDNQKIKVGTAEDLYPVMKAILLRESKTDRDREHFWTVSLDKANHILNIELVSMGSVSSVIVEPMEVFSIPLQKRAVHLIVVHNHPSGNLKPSATDLDITDQLIQCGLLLHVPLIDHLIITQNSYYSFEDNGLMLKLKLNSKHVPNFVVKRQAEKAGVDKGKYEAKKEIARDMKKAGYDPEAIAKVTGLTVASVKRLKT